MKKYFLKQIDSPRDTLRALLSASLVTALFGLVTLGRAAGESETRGDALSALTAIVGLYLLVNFSGIAWAAYSKLKPGKPGKK